MQLFFFLTLSLFSSICRVTYCFNTQARLSEFDIDEEEEDPIEKMLREIADEEKNFTKPRKKTNGTSLPFPKSDVVIDKTDFRTGFSAQADVVSTIIGMNPSLGECTVMKPKSKIKKRTNHKYQGDIVTTPLPKTTFIYSREAKHSETYDYRDVMGGVSISVLGLIGGSVEARVTTSAKRNRKSLVIYSRLRIHKAVVSLANPRVSTTWSTCMNTEKHYYLRDILTGMEDYIIVQIYFMSESKREDVEVKIRVNLFFFTITKTIREVKKYFSQDVRISIFAFTSFPIPTSVTKENLSVEGALVEIDKLEEERRLNIKAVKTSTDFQNSRLHLKYFFVPCLIKTIEDALPFTPARNDILVELIERLTEMESVLEDVKMAKKKSQGEGKRKLQQFEQDIVKQFSNIGDWRNKRYSRNLVEKMFSYYGTNRAPYYYERKLNRIMKDISI